MGGHLSVKLNAYCGNYCDEELRAISVGSCIGHAHYKRPVMFEHWMQLVLKLSPPNGLPTCSRTCSSSHW